MTFNFFKRDHKSITVELTPKLLAVFPRAINIEWIKAGDNYEALFYMDEAEYIARFSDKGSLSEYKKNVRTNEVPEEISHAANRHGEIMSAIAIYKGETLVHEIIVRKPDLSRYLLLLDNEGHLLEMRAV